MHRDPTFLQTLWFVLIGVLWVGYFVLEGFDFGVGMLLRAIGRTTSEKRALVHTIGPVWDGNEVWLLVAGGATFAAFPGWYASLFSGAYLALFLVLAGLIARGVAFEFWGKHDTPRWRATWEWAAAVGSFVPALLWGVAWANIVRGIPLNAEHDMTGSLLTLLNPYALLGGLTTLALFVAHGAIFLTLRLEDELLERAARIARVAAPVAGVLLTVFLGWTVFGLDGGVSAVPLVLAVAAVGLAAAVPLTARRERWALAFGLSAGAIALLVCVFFAQLFPNALPSTTSAAFDLTLREASSTSYTLTVMTVVAVLFVPLVVAYQAWTYWVFRARIGVADFEQVKSPIDLVAKVTGGTPGGGKSGGAGGGAAGGRGAGGAGGGAAGPATPGA
ncbi:cytochrome d ubiquinol oxidase subunit II [Conexibacter sp. CPCC 206217]|uniref:cytochrome d ubiquinol oxidase subunit II n=1 Tax=Conexibacter sp. CPCC 206217 TaxID=3064574 RepID=UPI00271A0D68|nr:cytochrome d ubiquinol oxidase subunit II [Conexibacter sp. CPCC 206217]MDO8213583.1 cytochrome d ubiquinol oxidase subunit II [Conexibacter sp. CPCC 206217]